MTIDFNPSISDAMRESIMATLRATEALRTLLRAKAQTKALGFGARNPLLDSFITDEFDRARMLAPTLKVDKNPLRKAADKLFQDIVKRSEA